MGALGIVVKSPQRRRSEDLQRIARPPALSGVEGCGNAMYKNIKQWQLNIALRLNELVLDF